MVIRFAVDLLIIQLKKVRFWHHEVFGIVAKIELVVYYDDMQV